MMDEGLRSGGLFSCQPCENVSCTAHGGINIGGPMMSLTRISAALTLALVLSATSMSAALARVGMSADGMLVLCIGHQVVTLPMGPDGQPQEIAHICPDCVMGALADFPAPSHPGGPCGRERNPLCGAPGRNPPPGRGFTALRPRHRLLWCSDPTQTPST